MPSPSQFGVRRPRILCQMFSSIIRVIPIVSLIGSAIAASYTLSDHVVGSDFNSFFSYEAIADPTHGRVNYVDQQTAQSQNLTFASWDTFILRADDTTTLNASGPGRNSAYAGGMRDVARGLDCTNGSKGEIDILEGVNDQTPNHATLHTSAGSGCTMPAASPSRPETGTPTGDDCDVVVNNSTNSAGCGVTFNDDSSYGPPFNSNGGGWYAMERTNSGINVWFWTRNESNAPLDVCSGSSSIDTSNWGTPVAFFPSTSCDISSSFGPHHIIINLTFCGDWAGQSTTYSNSGCPSTCVDYVNNNPSAFVNAYFDFASLDVFQ